MPTGTLNRIAVDVAQRNGGCQRAILADFNGIARTAFQNWPAWGKLTCIFLIAEWRRHA